uniref:Uncharacterized protein n=1 Tax=Panagrolaimus davidi TaxID=227884 RepID=A0A914R3H6_9BILA
MVKSPSGKVRTALGRLRGEAVKHAEKYKKILEQAPTPWDEDTRISMQAVGASMEADLSKFNDLWQKWEDINDEMADEDEQEADESLYNQWRDDPQYAVLLFTLDEYVQLIKSKLSFLLQSSNGSSSASTQNDSPASNTRSMLWEPLTKDSISSMLWKFSTKDEKEAERIS